MRDAKRKPFKKRLHPNPPPPPQERERMKNFFKKGLSYRCKRSPSMMSLVVAIMQQKKLFEKKDT
jgi:hypothetical protein